MYDTLICLSLQMKLMVALTSDKGVGSDDKIILEVSDSLDLLISLMKGGSLSSVSLLAAETVGNILVNKQVLQVHSVSGCFVSFSKHVCPTSTC